MSVSLKKLMNEYGIGSLIMLLIVVYGIYMFINYLTNKGVTGAESNSTMGPQYKNTNLEMSNNVKPAEPLGQNEVFASVEGIQTSTPEIATSCSKPNIQNPAELLPKDTNSQWAQLNPSGKGDLSNINLLNAGYHTGIDTVGQTMKNANLQVRSEPANPQLNTGPWNQSTIEPDFMRPPLELGAGVQ